MSSNNVTRLLDSRRITYQAFELPVEKLGAKRSAELLGAPPGQVFKTIVVVREKPGKPVLVVIPGTCEVNLKKVAAALGEKKMRLPGEREAEELTGLQGGVSRL
jgi:Cys-tRNA(Pro)/Cys-tRNA(Cys) deacylase